MGRLGNEIRTRFLPSAHHSFPAFISVATSKTRLCVIVGESNRTAMYFIKQGKFVHIVTVFLPTCFIETSDLFESGLLAAQSIWGHHHIEIDITILK